MKNLTVAELIERLKLLPQDKPIQIIADNFEFIITEYTTIEYNAADQMIFIQD